MKEKPERRTEEPRGSDRRILAVGKRVNDRWLVEVSLTRRHLASSRSGDARHADAA